MQLISAGSHLQQMLMCCPGLNLTAHLEHSGTYERAVMRSIFANSNGRLPLHISGKTQLTCRPFCSLVATRSMGFSVLGGAGARPMPGPGACPLGVVPALGAGARVSQYFRLGLRFGDCDLCFCSSCWGDDGRSWRLGGRERRRRCRPLRFHSLFFGSVELRAFG